MPIEVSNNARDSCEIAKDGPDFNRSAVYFRGYIRRKLPYSPNPSFRSCVGTSFYKASEIAGACCSGAPLPLWIKCREFLQFM